MGAGTNDDGTEAGAQPKPAKSKSNRGNRGAGGKKNSEKNTEKEPGKDIPVPDLQNAMVSNLITLPISDAPADLQRFCRARP